MSEVTIKALINAGAHFGHQTSRWNPKMKPYIFGVRNGIHIINLQKTMENVKDVQNFVTKLGTEGKTILFVGTKKQAQDIIATSAARCKMHFINYRWMGGTLTNMTAIKNSINRLNKIETMAQDGTYALLPKKEVTRLEKEKVKLKQSIGGIQKMTATPDAVFVVDPNYELIAVQEARCLKIPVIAVTDTNCDPDLINYMIPGNDDSLRSIKIFSEMVADCYLEGAKRYRGKPAAEAAAPATKAKSSRAQAGEEAAADKPNVDAPVATASAEGEEATKKTASKTGVKTFTNTPSAAPKKTTGTGKSTSKKTTK